MLAYRSGIFLDHDDCIGTHWALPQVDARSTWRSEADAMIRILLADDHALVREGLKQLFALTADVTIAAEAINGHQVLDILARDHFDLLLLDMTMPGLAGADLISRVLSLDAHPPILVLSMHGEPQIARNALAAGASGYLTKDNDPSILLVAIRKVAAGGRFIDSALAEAIAFAPPSQQPKRTPQLHSLSGRELQIFLLVAKGVGINDIAAALLISNKTVSTHKARLMEKMGFANNADLVRYAMQHGLID